MKKDNNFLKIFEINCCVKVSFSVLFSLFTSSFGLLPTYLDTLARDDTQRVLLAVRNDRLCSNT